MPPPFLDPDSLDDLNFSTPLKSLSQSSSNTSPLLVLSPSSLSHQPEILESLLSSIPAGQAHDLQMLDRIALDFAPLPPSTYSEAILALPPAEEKHGELENAYSELKNVFDKIINTLRPGGRLRIGQPQEYVKSDAVLAGFLVEQDGEQTVLVKPESTTAVPLRLKPKSSKRPKKRLDFLSLDLSDTIDESTLLEPNDFTKPLIQPLECQPAPGKRRKACKDCTCGLKELEEAEDAKARQLPVVVLGEDELDFTVQGKTGSCGNCGLGDAFRCSGCPFIGMPAFKPGEEIKLLREAARWADDI